jgi:trimeric autotransporter adhesin
VLRSGVVWSRRALVVVLAAGACGRLSFAPHDADGPPGANDGSTDDAAGVVGRTAYLKASNTETFDRFGTSVAVSGDGRTVAVGAFDEDGGSPGIDGDQTDNSRSLAGAVYVFVRAGDTWVQQAYVKASNPDAGDMFGTAVALSATGDTLAVVAPGEASAATGVNGNQADNSASGSGAIYVFTRAGTTWSQQAYLKASNTDAGDEMCAVALSGDGNTLAAGACGEASAASGVGGDPTDNSAPNAGAVYVFARVGATWSQQAYLKASNPDAGDRFGASVALAAVGDVLAVGAPSEASAATGVDANQLDNSRPMAGAVYVFRRGGAVWTQEAYVKASAITSGDFFGHALALAPDGLGLAVGAPGHDAVPNAGAVFLFARGTSWVEVARVLAPDAGNNDQLGASVGLTASVLVAGAPSEDEIASDSGAIYVFPRADLGGAERLKAPHPGAGDQFGRALAASGLVIVVGAREEDSGARGVDGDPLDNSAPYSGAAYVWY